MQRRWSLARMGGALIALGLLLVGFMAQAGPAAAYSATFANNAPIALNTTGPNNTPPNPSTINVSGFATGIQSVQVTTYNSSKVVNLNLSGPTAGQNYNFTIPAGTASTQIPLGTSVGTSPNGLWTLSVLDPTSYDPNNPETSPDSIAGGWSLFIVGQPAPTTTTVTVTPNPSVYGTTTYTLKATVLATTVQQAPTGIVTFSIGNTTLGSVSLVPSTANSSTATYIFDANSPINPATISAGSYTIFANYQGNGDFAASQDSATLVINKAATSVTNVAITPSSSVYGSTQTYTFSATITNISNSAPLQSRQDVVTFAVKDSNGQTVCQKDVNLSSNGTNTVNVSTMSGGNGNCTANLSSRNPGSYTVTATYASNANFLGSTGSGATGGVIVTKADTTLIITPPNAGNEETPGTIYCGITSVNLSATLTATNGAPFGLPTGSNGTVTFTVLRGTTPVGQTTVPVIPGASPQTVNGTVNLASDVRSGTYTVTATYTGSAQFNASTAQNSTLTITNANTATTISPVNVTATYGDANVQLSATVVRIQGQGSGAVNSGTVTFTVMKGKKTIGTVSGTVTNGTATANFPLSGVNADNYTFTAKYNGNDCYNASPNSDENIGTLKVAKRILWIKPVDQTRTSTQANPGCRTINDIQLYLENGAPPAGTGLAPGDTLQSAVTLANGFACTYGVPDGTTSRPTTPGKTTISVNSVLSDNYTIRYKTGTLTVTR